MGPLLLMGPLAGLYRARSSHPNPPRTNLSHISGHWCSSLTMSHLAELGRLPIILWLSLPWPSADPGAEMSALWHSLPCSGPSQAAETPWEPCLLVRGRWLGFLLCSPTFCTSYVPAKQSSLFHPRGKVTWLWKVKGKCCKSSVLVTCIGDQWQPGLTLLEHTLNSSLFLSIKKLKPSISKKL